jgi:hypothetical protein
MKWILVFMFLMIGCVQFPKPVVITQGAQTFNIGNQPCKQGCGLTPVERKLILNRRAQLAKLYDEKKSDRK